MQSWQPSASIDVLKRRAELYSQVRQFFNERGYLEVETPIMSRYGITDVYLSNIEAFFREQRLYLQTSPEYPMKRLLAAGSGPIYQLARVFRNDELGRWHNPEFTMLEWYQLDVDHHELMDEVDTFLQHMLGCQAMIRKTYQQIFKEYCNFDPFSTTLIELRDILKQYNLSGVLAQDEQDRDQYLFLLLSHVVEPALAQESNLIAIYDFPPSQAALAKISNGLAQRFEVYYKGVELANGFHELTDTNLQRQRFEMDLQLRASKGLVMPEPDEYLLAALEHGLPQCSGVALGIDRLVAFALDCDTLSNVLAFNFSRS